MQCSSQRVYLTVQVQKFHWNKKLSWYSHLWSQSFIIQVYTFPAVLHTRSINTVFFNFKLRLHYAVSGKECFRGREKAQYNTSLNQKDLNVICAFVKCKKIRTRGKQNLPLTLRELPHTRNRIWNKQFIISTCKNFHFNVQSLNLSVIRPTIQSIHLWILHE